jgi:hypothetical protein
MFTLKEECKLQVSENITVLRKILGMKQEDKRNGRYYTTRNFVIYIGQLILFGQSNLRGNNVLDRYFGWGNMKHIEIVVLLPLRKWSLEKLRRWQYYIFGN